MEHTVGDHMLIKEGERLVKIANDRMNKSQLSMEEVMKADPVLQGGIIAIVRLCILRNLFTVEDLPEDARYMFQDLSQGKHGF